MTFGLSRHDCPRWRRNPCEATSVNGPDERDREIADLRERLARLSEAGLRITEDLDFNTVLQGVLDSARFPDRSPLRRHHAARRRPDSRALPVLGDDRRGDGAALDEPGLAQPLRIPKRDSRSPAGARPARPHQVPRSPRPDSPSGGEREGVLHGDPRPAPGRARRQHLPRREGARAGVHARGRGDAGGLRLPGGHGHHQRAQAPRGAAGQGRPGDA